MYLKRFAILVLSIFVWSCSYPKENYSLKLDLDLQSHTISNRSLTSSLLYPILKVHNPGPDTIFVYYKDDPFVLLDSSNHTIKLTFSIEKLPENITYYEFKYPIFVSIPPESNIDLYTQVQLYEYIKTLPTGTWELFANIGYLSKAELFKGYLDHGLRDQITSYQKLLVSNRTNLDIINQ